MKYADLHVHTLFSDGTFTPEEVVKCASEKGLSAIAICDHDSVDALAPAAPHAKKLNIEIIPGVELTVMKEGKEIHLLGYYIQWREKWFNDILRRVQAERIVRIDRMIEKLKGFNVNIDRKTVTEISGGQGSLGRLHLARALAETGAVSSVNEAFAKYIGDSKPCYVEDIGFGPKEAVDLILRAKGVPVLAHPVTIGDDSLVHEFIKHGIRGIEVFHSDHSASKSKKYKKIAEENGLLPLGGSDCHGLGKGKVLMGSVKIPYGVVEKLKKEAEKIKQR